VVGVDLNICGRCFAIALPQRTVCEPQKPLKSAYKPTALVVGKPSDVEFLNFGPKLILSSMHSLDFVLNAGITQW
jgi:hypothetical protein